MRLNDLLTGLISGLATDIDITGLALDSREVKAGNAFIALSGSKQHGLAHAEQAIQQGASVILYDPDKEGGALAAKISAVQTLAITNLNVKLGHIASRFYGHPSAQLAVIGITGTNGKTSCSHFLSQLLDDCAIIGTLGWGIRGALHETINTTPDALSVQRMFYELSTSGSKAVAMEVSSHALEQGRVNGVNFKGVVFTNVSRDHLDYHGTMEAYLAAKLLLLNKPGISFAVVNLDDPYCEQVLANIPASVTILGCSAKGKTMTGMECLWASEITHNAEGIAFTVNWQEDALPVHVPLYGDFNIENLLSTLAVCLAMGKPLLELVNQLPLLMPVAGRMEPQGGGMLPLVFVDYAHTPDALEKVLTSVKQHCQGKLWLVFGCGGNRDSGKRAQMGAIAEQWADRIVVTDDNPRFETSDAIIKEIISGCQNNQADIIPDRKSAITHAVLNAAVQDCIVVAGKGHEPYQEIAGVKMPFSDRQIVMEILNRRMLGL